MPLLIDHRPGLQPSARTDQPSMPEYPGGPPPNEMPGTQPDTPDIDAPDLPNFPSGDPVPQPSSFPPID